MRFNVSPTKELRVSLLQDPLLFENLSSSGSNIEIVHDFTWNTHVKHICAKASKRLYAVGVLKGSGAPTNDLITLYCSFIRPVLEYACAVWYFSLAQTLLVQIEHSEKRALKIVYPYSPSYTASLDYAGIFTLHQRRLDQCQTL